MVDKWVWIRIALLLALSSVILLNSTTLVSPAIGIPASLGVIFISAEAVGEIFFSKEKRFLKQTLGLVVFIAILALLGTSLMLTAKFTETLSLVGFAATGLIVCLGSTLARVRARKHTNAGNDPEQLETENKKRESYLLIVPFLLSVAIAFYALLSGRTGEGGMSVWLTIPRFFLPVFFTSTLSLVIIIFFTEINTGLKLGLISMHSFLSHSLFLIIWYPGRYGDPWAHLGEARFIDRAGTFYAYDWVMSQRLISDIVKYKSQYALVVLFRRAFSLDIYWVQVFLIPLLWSIFVPFILYELIVLLSARKTKTLPLLGAISAGLLSPMIYWGAISVPNSLGFLLLLLVIMLLLYWADRGQKRILLLSLLVCVATFFAHPQTGLFAFAFVFVVLIAQSRLHSIMKFIFLIMISAAYPIVTYLQGATFSQAGLLSPENLMSFQVEITTLALVFGFLGLIVGIKGNLIKGRSARLLFLFYIVTAGDYYISMFGMQNTLVPDRILPILDLLLVPFIGTGLMVITNFLKDGLSHLKANPLKKTASPRSIALLMICLFLSLQITFVLNQTYPSHEINEVQPAAYEIQAIYYIDSDAPGRYLVLCEPSFAILGAGFLGADYSYGTGRGMFGVPEWGWWTIRLYSQMGLSPSISLLEQAMARARIGVVYFVVSVRDPAYEDIVKRTSQVLPVDNVFGDGKLTVFKYLSTLVPISGSGPNVDVTFDDGTSAEVQSKFNYLFLSDVRYTIELSGHSSYNVTDYPMYWTFLWLRVNGDDAHFDARSDVNTFVYIEGLSANDAVEVAWRADEHYPHAGWKEDSFKYGWQTHPLYTGTITPNITTDGNILSLSADFSVKQIPFNYYYYVKNATVLTDDYPDILVKWKSTGPVATVAVAYTDSTSEQHEVVPYSSENQDWTVTEVKLEPGKQVAYIMVGITNLYSRAIAGVQELYIDYILICALEK